MNNTALTESFKRRSFNLEDMKEKKISVLKTNTEKIILEKYPYHKQLNDKNFEMQNWINRVRAICKRIEGDICFCSEDEINLIDVSDKYLRICYE